MEYGRFEERFVFISFSPKYYYDALVELKSQGVDIQADLGTLKSDRTVANRAALTFLHGGIDQGYSGSPIFEANYYLDNNKDAKDWCAANYVSK